MEIRYPGVYIEEVGTFGTSVAEVQSAAPAFRLYAAVLHFFANVGGSCFVYSVGRYRGHTRPLACKSGWARR